MTILCPCRVSLGTGNQAMPPGQQASVSVAAERWCHLPNGMSWHCAGGNPPLPAPSHPQAESGFFLVKKRQRHNQGGWEVPITDTRQCFTLPAPNIKAQLTPQTTFQPLSLITTWCCTFGQQVHPATIKTWGLGRFFLHKYSWFSPL